MFKGIPTQEDGMDLPKPVNTSKVNVDKSNLDDDEDEEMNAKIVQLRHRFEDNLINEEQAEDDEEVSDSEEEAESENTKKSSETKSRLSYLKFRNYKPNDNVLKKYVMTPKIVLPQTEADDQDEEEEQEAEKVVKSRWATIEDQTEEMLEEQIAPILKLAAQQSKLESSNSDLPLTLLPQKLNWDLKRMVMKRLQTLEKKTQQALAELLEEKIKQEEAEESDDDEEEEEGSEEEDDEAENMKE